MRWRIAPCLTELVMAFFAVCIVSSVAHGETIRFSPGPRAPLVFNPTSGLYEEAGNFDPLVCGDVPCAELLHNVFEPLVSVSSGQTIESCLAIHWERLDDVRFRFTLRRGVTFHNGEPFNAEAVRFSLMRTSEAYGATSWFPKIAQVEIPSPYSAEVVLSAPDSLFLYRLGHLGLIQPPRYFRRVGAAQFGAHPVGTGAFRFIRWDEAQREVVLEGNEQYWRKGHPKVKRLIYKYTDSETALDLLTKGRLDLIGRLNPRKTTQFMETRKGSVVKAWLPQLVLGVFNPLKRESPLKDLKVRQAINLAINREDLLRYGAIGNGRLLGGYAVPEDPNRAPLPPYPLDLPKARRLLDEAGYSKGFTVSMFVDEKAPPNLENIVAASLSEVGITVRARKVSQVVAMNELYLRKFEGGAPPSFDILWISAPLGTIFHSGYVPMTFLYSKKANDSTVRDPVLDQLYEEALRTYDDGRTATLWKKLEEYVYANHLLLIGYQERAVFGANRRLHFTPRSLMTFWDAYYEK